LSFFNFGLFTNFTEINVRDFIKNMPEAEKGEFRPENWLNPDYFEFTQPEYSAIMASQTHVSPRQLEAETANDKV
jgi:hypothetical protein